MDARLDGIKQKISWTHALREIVTSCYRYHGREDLLPVFKEDEEEGGVSHKKETDEEAIEAKVARALGSASPVAVKNLPPSPEQGVTVTLTAGPNGQLIATPVSTAQGTFVSRIT